MDTDTNQSRANGKETNSIPLTVITDDKKNENDKKADFERAVQLTGYGKFHVALLIVCGMVSTSEEMDVISMSFILPSAECDLNLNTNRKGWLNSIIFIGMMVGAYLWGSVADSVGRKQVLIIISFMNGICIVASSFSQSYWEFMVFRFLNGAALGGSGPVVWSYFAEFQPKGKRGSMLSCMAAFWTLGNLFVASLAWLIIPRKLEWSSESGFHFNSWRLFLVVCSFPSFLVTVLLFYFPESPKFLISRGLTKDALQIFGRIYSLNTGHLPETYPVQEIIVSEKVNQGCDSGSPTAMLKQILLNTKSLFVPPILRFSTVSITINFTFHIGYYGLMMWFPELFNRYDEYVRAVGKETASVCEVSAFAAAQPQDINCTDRIHSGVFHESFITVASALPSNILAVLFMDYLGRKFFMVVSTVSSGLCAVVMSVVQTKTQNLIVSAVFSSVISSGNAALDCLITEIFPTNLRATGVAISMVFARLGGIVGNIVIATLLDKYCPAPTFIVAALLIGGGLLSLFLPNTTKVPLA